MRNQFGNNFNQFGTNYLLIILRIDNLASKSRKKITINNIHHTMFFFNGKNNDKNTKTKDFPLNT